MEKQTEKRKRVKRKADNERKPGYNQKAIIEYLFTIEGPATMNNFRELPQIARLRTADITLLIKRMKENKILQEEPKGFFAFHPDYL